LYIAQSQTMKRPMMLASRRANEVSLAKPWLLKMNTRGHAREDA
jgi:hypothetical protein